MTGKTAKTNITPVRQRIDWTTQPLRQMPDIELARDLGVSKSSLALRARMNLGITASGQTRVRKGIWPTELEHYDLGLLPTVKKEAA